MRIVAIVGLGYVGLPLAVLASAKGWRVLGVDINADKVAAINAGTSTLADAILDEQLRRHPLVASTDPSIVREAEVIVVAVPTPVTADNEPDLRPLTNALQSILPHLVSGQALIIESTINPGVMDEVVRPLVESRHDITIHLAHCPERINPADPRWTVRNIPRVLGAYTPEGVRLARLFYESILDVPLKIMASPTEAEAVKILENTFRDVNIAFINEMAKSFAALNINILNVIEGAATKPFAFMPHWPGNGVGGHCISVDPYYMIARARAAGFDHKFLRLAREINDSMPAYTTTLLAAALAEHQLTIAHTPIALLGVAYKKNVADTRRSPALAAVRLLTAQGATVHVFDPLVPAKSTVSSLSEALDKSTAVLLACDHDALLATLTPVALAQANIKVVIDGKNSLNGTDIARHGITYRGIGQPAKPAVAASDSRLHSALAAPAASRG